MRRVLDLAKLAFITSRGSNLQSRSLGLRQPSSGFFGFSRDFSIPSGINRAGNKREGSSSNKGSDMPPSKGFSESKSKSKSSGSGRNVKGSGSGDVGSKSRGKGKTNKQQIQQHSSPSKYNFRKTTKSSIGKTEPPTTNSVKHDKEKNRFTLDLGNKQEARVDYRSIGKDSVEMYHSEVPQELRGLGIGKALAKGAIEQALKNNMKVKLTCSYLINFLEKFADPKLKSIVENNKNDK